MWERFGKRLIAPLGVPTFFPCVFPAKQERKEITPEVFCERMRPLKASLSSIESVKRGLLRKIEGSLQLLGVSRPSTHLEILLYPLIHVLLSAERGKRREKMSGPQLR